VTLVSSTSEVHMATTLVLLMVWN